MRKGVIRADIPSINKIFAILLPITFPTAISGVFFNMASTETVISGIDVPKPTITELTKILEIFKCLATDTAPLMSASPPKYKIIMPDIMATISIAILLKQIWFSFKYLLFLNARQPAG